MFNYLIQRVDLISRWRQFLTLLGINVKDSDKKGYDMMLPRKYSVLYIKVHLDCPWKDSKDNTLDILHLCSTLNLYPSDVKQRYIDTLLMLQGNVEFLSMITEYLIAPIFLYCTFSLGGHSR